MTSPSTDLAEIHARLDAGDARMARIEADLTALRADLQTLKTQIDDLIEFFGSLKGAWKVLDWLGKLAKPLGAIVGLGAAFAALWAAIKAGGTR